MKVLLLTGMLAKQEVESYAKESKVETEVLALKVPVAAFLTTKIISQALKQSQVKSFDLILVPGLIRGNTSVISKETGIPAFKGPQYAADLPILLDSLNETKLSTVVPADDLLREKLLQKAIAEIAKVETNREAFLRNPGNIMIKNLAVGKDFPMRVMGEIVDAALKSDEEIKRLAKDYVEAGADIIDVGMLACESRPQDAKRVITAVKAAVDIPVSIDSLNPEEIKAAVSAGADLVLSADAGNIESIAPFIKNVAVVAIPTNQQEGYFPKKAAERVQFLEDVIAKAKNAGVINVLGDLILDPLDILESFIAFRLFAERNPSVPLFVGISNVTELIDADSIGVNAILAKLSSEVSASMLLATEKSDKAQGTIKEESTAAKMMFLAKKRRSVPKDLGINLLVLKDKRKREEPYNLEIEKNTPLLLANKNGKACDIDKQGSFRIIVDRQSQNIMALHLSQTNQEIPDLVVKGKTADVIYKKVIGLGLISKFDHAAYLGSELTKAQIALKTGKEYLQDKAMFEE